MPAQATTGVESRSGRYSRFLRHSATFSAWKEPHSGRIAGAIQSGAPASRNFANRTIHGGIAFMKLRRFMLCALSVGLVGGAVLVQAEGWTPRPFASQTQSEPEGPAVQKDDSQLWVVERPMQSGTPIVDTAAKKKKPSAWNKVWHPSQWFSSSKKK
jgi:hypothetical protein